MKRGLAAQSIDGGRDLGTSVPFLYFDETLLVPIIVSGRVCSKDLKNSLIYWLKPAISGLKWRVSKALGFKH